MIVMVFQVKISVNPGLLVLAISRNFINLVMTAIFLNEIWKQFFDNNLTQLFQWRVKYIFFFNKFHRHQIQSNDTKSSWTLDLKTQ